MLERSDLSSSDLSQLQLVDLLVDTPLVSVPGSEHSVLDLEELLDSVAGLSFLALEADEKKDWEQDDEDPDLLAASLWWFSLEWSHLSSSALGHVTVWWLCTSSSSESSSWESSFSSSVVSSEPLSLMSSEPSSEASSVVSSAVSSSEHSPPSVMRSSSWSRSGWLAWFG